MAYGSSHARGQIGTCNFQPMLQLQQHGFQAVFATQTTVHCNTGSLTHWAKPGTKPKSSWIIVRFVTAELPWEHRLLHFNLVFCYLALYTQIILNHSVGFIYSFLISLVSFYFLTEYHLGWLRLAKKCKQFCKYYKCTWKECKCYNLGYSVIHSSTTSSLWKLSVYINFFLLWAINY